MRKSSLCPVLLSGGRSTHAFVDLRKIYRPPEMAAKGFVYVSVGRPTPAAPG
jgi:hypothetical protein